MHNLITLSLIMILILILYFWHIHNNVRRRQPVKHLGEALNPGKEKSTKRWIDGKEK